MFGDGCRISDRIDACHAGAGNHGDFVSCVAHLGTALREQGVITSQGRAVIQACAAHAD